MQALSFALLLCHNYFAKAYLTTKKNPWIELHLSKDFQSLSVVNYMPRFQVMPCL